MTPDDIRADMPEPMHGLSPWLRMKAATALNLDDATALRGWAADVSAHTAQIAALEAQLADGSFYKESDIDAMQDRIKALEDALTNFKEFYPMGINPYLDDAYRQALKLLAKDKP